MACFCPLLVFSVCSLMHLPPISRAASVIALTLCYPPLLPILCHFRGTTAALNVLDDDKTLTQALADLLYLQLQPLRTFLLTEVRLQGARSAAWKHPACCPAFSWFRGCNQQTEPSQGWTLPHVRHHVLHVAFISMPRPWHVAAALFHFATLAHAVV